MKGWNPFGYLKYYQKGEDSLLFITDIEMQKRRYQIGLGTLVVYAVTDGYSIFNLLLRILVNALNIPPEDYDRKVKTQSNWRKVA